MNYIILNLNLYTQNTHKHKRTQNINIISKQIEKALSVFHFIITSVDCCENYEFCCFRYGEKKKRKSNSGFNGKIVKSGKEGAERDRASEKNNMMKMIKNKMNKELFYSQ